MKVLITGFQPFGGETMNPAYEAIKQLPEEIAGARIVKKEIPVVFRKGGNVVYEAIKQEQPDIVICVGQAGGRIGITPEFVGINYQDARIPDNDGNQPNSEAIQPDGPAAYFTKLPVKAMVAEMQKKDIPASISYSAGTYVCNDVMYQLLYDIDKSFPHIKGGFIHVPYATEQVVDKPGSPSLSLETIAKGLEICIYAVLENETDRKEVGGVES